MQSNTQSTSTSSPFLSLRDRCDIKFRLSLAPPAYKSIQPSCHNLPRRRRRNCVPAVSAKPCSPSSPKPGKLGSHLKRFPRPRGEENYYNPVHRGEHVPFAQACRYLIGVKDNLPPPTTPRFAKRGESRGLQEIVPGCHVAFEDDNAAWFGPSSKDALPTPRGGIWTHIVSISQAPTSDCVSVGSGDSSNEPDSDVTSSRSSSSDGYDDSTQTLRLYLPSEPNVEAEDEDARHTILSDDQLLTARDFLLLHRNPPHGSDGGNPSSPSSSTSSLSSRTMEKSSVRLLITAPRNRRADALSTAISYLAFALDAPVDTFLLELHSQRQCLPVWKDVLDIEGIQRVKRIVGVSRI